MTGQQPAARRPARPAARPGPPAKPTGTESLFAGAPALPHPQNDYPEPNPPTRIKNDCPPKPGDGQPPRERKNQASKSLRIGTKN